MTATNVTLINQKHDVKGQVIEFKDELMRVQVTEEHTMETSEYVLVLYKGKQIQSKVISTKPGEINVFIPLLPEDYFSDRRNFPRVRADFPAVLLQRLPGQEERIIRVRVHDVSYRGFSFTLENDDYIESEHVTKLIVQSEQLPVVCDLIVNSSAEQFGRLRYGASIHFMSNSNIRLLYGYMFSRQV